MEPIGKRIPIIPVRHAAVIPLAAYLLLLV